MIIVYDIVRNLIRFLRMFSFLFQLSSVSVFSLKYCLHILKTLICIVSFCQHLTPYLLKQFFFLSGFSLRNIHKSQELQGNGEGISLAPHYHFHRSYRHLQISRVITAGGSPLRIEPGSNREPLVSERKSLTTKLRVLV